jgi:hypothetical protein
MQRFFADRTERRGGAAAAAAAANDRVLLTVTGSNASFIYWLTVG